MMLAVVVLAIAAFGFGWAAAQSRTSAATLTAQDYFEIQQLYGQYTHAIDHGERDGKDFAATFLPDGVFVHVRPAANPCRPLGEIWEVGNREDIRGSIADAKNIDVCVSKLVGTQKLATLAATSNSEQRRRVHTNFLVSPTAEGATVTLYLNELNVMVRPPTWTGTGIYYDTLVRTPNGWRFRQRIMTQDAVFAGRPNS
jgi:hypothetical protein